jgi:serine/threonine-protein kinase RsbW
MRAALDQLSAMREFVTRAVLALGGDSDLASDVELAADEAITNVIVHGYGRQGGEIELAMAREGGNLVLRILDAAAEFDPTGAPSPDIKAPLETRGPGGFGIFLIRQLMDGVTYRRLTGGLNELTLTKRGAFDRWATAEAGSD